MLLGNQNDSKGHLSPVAISRADTAICVLQEDEERVVLPTGAFGAHFNTTEIPHGQYLTNYLVKNGINANRILPLTNSSNTVEDAICAKKVVDDLEASHLVVVTSDFHMQRVKYIFGRIFREMTITYKSAPNRVDYVTLAKLLKHEAHALGKLQQAWAKSDPNNLRPYIDKG